MPDEKWGEAVKAFVVKKDGVRMSEQDVCAHVRAHLADYKCPKHVQFLRELPRNETGKILKRELAAGEPPLSKGPLS